eukprot:scaffold3962_cov122-Isochrysis_galbana.AAC.4
MTRGAHYYKRESHALCHYTLHGTAALATADGPDGCTCSARARASLLPALAEGSKAGGHRWRARADTKQTVHVEMPAASASGGGAVALRRPTAGPERARVFVCLHGAPHIRARCVRLATRYLLSSASSPAPARRRRSRAPAFATSLGLRTCFVLCLTILLKAQRAKRKEKERGKRRGSQRSHAKHEI